MLRMAIIAAVSAFAGFALEGPAAATDMVFPQNDEVAFAIHISDDWAVNPASTGSLLLVSPDHSSVIYISVKRDKAGASQPIDQLAAQIFTDLKAEPFYRHEPASIGSTKADAYYGKMDGGKLIKLLMIQAAGSYVVFEAVMTGANELSASQQKSLDDAVHGITLNGVK